MASIQKTNKGYRFRVYYYDDSGKRRCISKSGFRTQGEAKKAAILIEADIDSMKIKKKIPTLKEYIDKYIEVYRQGNVSPSSVDIDRWSEKRLFSVTHHLVDDNGETVKRTISLYDKTIPIDRITGTMHQQVINKLFDSGLSLSTIKKTNSLMYRVMERARFDGYITFNPAELITYRQVEQTKKAEYIPHSKIAPFLADVKRRNIYHYYLFRLIIETGLRVGEACALTLQDIDRKNHVIHVTKSYDQKRNKLGTTKTKHHRDVYISKNLVDELSKLITLHQTNAIVNEDCYNNNYNFIFVDPLGRPISRSSIHNTMQYCSEKILGKNHRMSVHKLRHTHATLLLESQVPLKVIQERLGHQSMAMTEKVYAHVTPDMKNMAREKYDKFIKNIF